MGLTNKQRAFIAEYLRDFNATQAAIRAGYSEKTAYSIGQRLLKNVEVSEAIKSEIDERYMTSEEVGLRLSDMARGDMGDFLDISGVGFNIDLDKAKELGLTKLIKKVKQRTTITSKSGGEEEENHWIEFELYDALAALVQLGRVHSMFTDKTDVTSGGERIDLQLWIERARKNAAEMTEAVDELE
jgi:phage terminase small subunit